MSSFKDELMSSAYSSGPQYEPITDEQPAQTILDASRYPDHVRPQAAPIERHMASTDLSPLVAVLAGAVVGFVIGSWWGRR